MKKNIIDNLTNIEKLADSIIKNEVLQHKDVIELNSELDIALEKIMHQKKYFKRL